MRFSMCMAAIVAVACLPSCRTTPGLAATPQVACGLAPDIWHEVETPAEREVLLRLPEKTTQRPIGEYLAATADQREVWFEDANHGLQACVYDPINTCRGGGRRNVVFSKLKDSWVTGEYTQTFCFH